MNVRGITDRDYDKLKDIHSKFYRDEFPFPEFNNNCLVPFIVEDDKGKIITAGEVKAIAEVILITDKSVEIRERRKALFRAMQVAIFTANRNKFDQLHAFVQGSNWHRHLKKAGFVESKGQPLVYNIGE